MRLSELIALVGYVAAEELISAWGPGRIYIPETPGQDHPITLRIGPYRAKDLAARCGGGPLELPAPTALLKQRRNDLIRAAYHEGAPKRALARRYGLSPRTIRQIVKETPRCKEHAQPETST